MSYIDDKRELLKQRQGLLNETKTDDHKKTDTYERPRGFKTKMSNYWYHYKWQTIGAIWGSVIIAFFVHSFLTHVREDISILAVSDSSDVTFQLMVQADYLGELFGIYSPDFNNDGKSAVSFSVIDLYADDYTDPTYLLANKTKLMGQIENYSTLVFMGNKSALTDLLNGGDIDKAYVDLGEMYPTCEFVEDNYFFKLNGSGFQQKTGWEGCPTDLYMVLRKTSSEAVVKEKIKILNNNSIEFMNSIIMA